MGFFKSLKGDHPDKIGSASSNTEEKKDGKHHEETYAPPPGAPPSRSRPGAQVYMPAVGQSEYAPPLGPPPSHKQLESTAGQSEYAPPPGPPPSHRQNAQQPAPYHDWTSIPDTALLPPPPALGHEASPSSNANLSDAERAHDWCARYPLIRPHLPTEAQIMSVRNGDVRLIQPQEYSGELVMPSTGFWRGSTRAGSKDSCLLTSLPLYFASADSPFQTEITKIIYFEAKIVSFGRGRGMDETSLALGYCAVPYPTWRMPGWERGSLAVHSDDGRRYVNDTFGGKDFTTPIKAGETVGIGISFSIPDTPPEYGAPPTAATISKAEVFFTRNGRKDGGWNLHEELDGDNEFGVLGLDGQFDLYGAVGIFGGVEFEVSFNSRDWLWQPR
ncbi:hypothetical protein MMC24_001423 [Lignoscripta atroalba]|nr:hypothetical protein [Lignoscripta atroalba]